MHILAMISGLGCHCSLCLSGIWPQVHDPLLWCPDRISKHRARAGAEPQELRALMSQMEMGEVAVAGQAVALAHWHAVRTVCTSLRVFAGRSPAWH